MKIKLFFLLLMSLMSCGSFQEYFEVRQPFKNYTENPSYLAPINSIKSNYIFRIWFFDSTSVDKVLVIFKNEKDEFESQIISFGKVYKDKKFKEVYATVDVIPKNGFGNLIHHIKNESLEKFQNKTDSDFFNDEPVFQYFFEIKSINEKTSFKYVTSKSQLNNENKYSNLVKYLKSEFNLKQNQK
jgi:hypothetical protein